MNVLVYNFKKLDWLSNSPDMRNFNKTKLLSLCGNVLPLILVLLLTLPDLSFLSYKGNYIANSTLNSSINELSSNHDLYVQDGDNLYIELSECRIIEIVSPKLRFFQSNSELRTNFICSHRHSRSPPTI